MRYRSVSARLSPRPYYIFLTASSSPNMTDKKVSDLMWSLSRTMAMASMPNMRWGNPLHAQIQEGRIRTRLASESSLLDHRRRQLSKHTADHSAAQQGIEECNRVLNTIEQVLRGYFRAKAPDQGHPRVVAACSSGSRKREQ